MARNDSDAQASYSRLVQINVDGNAYQATYFRGTLQPRQEVDIPFELVQQVGAADFSGRQDVEVGVSTLETLSAVPSALVGLSLRVD